MPQLVMDKNIAGVGGFSDWQLDTVADSYLSCFAKKIQQYYNSVAASTQDCSIQMKKIL